MMDTPWRRQCSSDDPAFTFFLGVSKDPDLPRVGKPDWSSLAEWMRECLCEKRYDRLCQVYDVML